MNNPLDSQDYVAGALAAVSGDIEIKQVAGCNTGLSAWYRVCDPSSEECRAVVATGYGEHLFCEPCDPDDRAEFTKAFIKTLRFGESEAEPYFWTSALEDGWVDQEWIDLQILRAILEQGAAELGTDFNFDAWVVEGVRGKKPKGKKRKQAEP
jgi:hypothetical protein